MIWEGNATISNPSSWSERVTWGSATVTPHQNSGLPNKTGRKQKTWIKPPTTGGDPSHTQEGTQIGLISRPSPMVLATKLTRRSAMEGEREKDPPSKNGKDQEMADPATSPHHLAVRSPPRHWLANGRKHYSKSKAKFWPPKNVGHPGGNPSDKHEPICGIEWGKWKLQLPQKTSRGSQRRLVFSGEKEAHSEDLFSQSGGHPVPYPHTSAQHNSGRETKPDTLRVSPLFLHLSGDSHPGQCRTLHGPGLAGLNKGKELSKGSFNTL